MRRALGVYADIGDVVPSDEDVAIARDEAVLIVLFGSLEHHVHVPVRPGHPAPVFSPVLEGDRDVVSDRLYQHVEWLLPWLQA